MLSKVMSRRAIPDPRGNLAGPAMSIKYFVLPASKADLEGMYNVRHHSEGPKECLTSNWCPPHLWLPAIYRPSPTLPSSPWPVPEPVIQDRIKRFIAVRAEKFDEEAKKGVIWTKACLVDADSKENNKIVGFSRLEPVNLWDPNPHGFCAAIEASNSEKSKAEKELERIQYNKFFDEIQQKSSVVKKKVLPAAECSWYMQMLYVHRDYQGVGIGRALLADAFSKAKEDGKGYPLYWEADPEAEAFYFKHGAERVGEISVNCWDKGWIEGNKVEAKFPCMVKWPNGKKLT